MKTKTIFNEGGIQVWETDNKDPRGKEWHIAQGMYGCSIGFKPELNVEWLKEYLKQYLQDRKDSLDTEPIDRPITND